MNPESKSRDHILFCRETLAFNSGLFPLLPVLTFLETSSALQTVKSFHSQSCNYLTFSGYILRQTACSPGWPPDHCMVKGSFELLPCLLQPPECWGREVHDHTLFWRGDTHHHVAQAGFQDLPALVFRLRVCA